MTKIGTSVVTFGIACSILGVIKSNLLFYFPQCKAEEIQKGMYNWCDNFVLLEISAFLYRQYRHIIWSKLKVTINEMEFRLPFFLINMRWVGDLLDAK